MKVEIWSDVACPFCYIGKHRFEAGLERFANRGEVEVVYKSFELDPNAPANPSYDLHDMLAKKFGVSREQAAAMNRQVAEGAQDTGIEFRFERAIPANTRDAHRLIKYAGEFGKSGEMAERLYKAYFTEGRHVGDVKTLADIAAEAGLDRDVAAEALNGGKYADEVVEDSREAGGLGARGVPFFVIDRKYAVSGAQSSEVFREALERAWQASHPALTPISADADGAMCEDGACAPKEKPE